MTTNPARSKCRTIRSATIAAMYVSESWTRFLSLNSRANAIEPAMSLIRVGRGELLIIGHPRTIADGLERIKNEAPRGNGASHREAHERASGGDGRAPFRKLKGRRP
jgi:hypothetical protein